MRRTAIAVLLLVAALGITTATQTKPPATFADYGQWETLATAGARGGFSPDGRWIAYAINRSNRNNELRVVRLADGRATVAAFGAQPAWSADSKWIAYAVGMPEAESEKLRAEKKPVQNKLGLLNPATGETSTLEAIESFAFSADGGYLAVRPYGPERPAAPAATGGDAGRGGAGDAAGRSDEAPGTTLIVRDLASGRDISFGNVSGFAWQDAPRSHLLAMTISAAGKSGNGVHLYDPATGVLRVLESSPTTYTGLVWRKDSADLVVLRTKTDDGREGATHVVLAWTGLDAAGRPRAYDPTADTTFPVGLRTVSFRRLSWSDDGQVVFLGVATWDQKVAAAGKGRGGAAGGGTEGAGPGGAPAGQGSGAVPGGDAEAATVDVWHAKDVFVMPWQRVHAATDRQRTVLAAWRLDSGRLVFLGKDPVSEQVTPIRRSNLALVAEWSAYAMNRTIGRPAADLYLCDTTSGDRTKLETTINDRYVQPGPSGKYLLFLRDDHYWTINLATRAVTNITRTVPTSFIDRESDQTIAQKPPFGPAFWTKEDGSVLLYDKYDIWRVPADGSKAQRLTTGAAERIRHRLVRLDPDEEWIDLSQPVYVSVFGERSKRSGYARLAPTGAVDRLVWLDKNVGSLGKAKEADVYGYITQGHDDSPDLFVGGADLAGAKQVTATNAFQDTFAWSRSDLLDYQTEAGRPLQGALYYPAGYETGRKYPMIVYVYELLSQNVHRYVAPSDREYYNTSVFTSHGYFVLQPDIVFTPRQPGVSVVQCVLAGVRKAIQSGMVDPKRVGVVGHSMGGFDAAYLATHTTGVFAAAVAGAPITDLVSYYGDHHWSSGIAETDHIETGQERMEVALYEDFPAYVANSPVFNVHRMTVPLLLEAGDVDGTVAWHQSIELYNIARRAGKNVVMLAYMGEDHGLRQKKNQTDYQARILGWFGHYLKGEAAEAWITRGLSFLDREAEVKRLGARK